MQLRNGLIRHWLRHEAGRVIAEIQRDAPIHCAQRATTDPNHLAHRHELVQEARVVAGHAAPDHVPLDDAGRQSQTLKLEDDLQQPIHARRPRTDAMPFGKEASENLGRNRLDLAPQGRERAAPQ